MDKSIYADVSDELNIPPEVIEKAYKSFWEFLRNKIEELPLKEDLTEEEFDKLRTNFNIPSLGKMGCIYGRYRALKDGYKVYKKLKEDAENKEDKANV